MNPENPAGKENEPVSTIEIGGTYEHEGGIQYRVDSIVLDATNYESGQEPRRVVMYTQLGAGKFPTGTQWVREEQDFLRNFKKVEK